MISARKVGGNSGTNGNIASYVIPRYVTQTLIDPDDLLSRPTIRTNSRSSAQNVGGNSVTNGNIASYVMLPKPL